MRGTEAGAEAGTEAGTEAGAQGPNLLASAIRARSSQRQRSGGELAKLAAVRDPNPKPAARAHLPGSLHPCSGAGWTAPRCSRCCWTPRTATPPSTRWGAVLVCAGEYWGVLGIAGEYKVRSCVPHCVIQCYHAFIPTLLGGWGVPASQGAATPPSTGREHENTAWLAMLCQPLLAGGCQQGHTHRLPAKKQQLC